MHDQQGGITRAWERWPGSKSQCDLHWPVRLELFPGPGSAIGHEGFPILGPDAVKRRFTESAVVNKLLPIGRNPGPPGVISKFAIAGDFNFINSTTKAPNLLCPLETPTMDKVINVPRN